MDHTAKRRQLFFGAALLCLPGLGRAAGRKRDLFVVTQSKSSMTLIQCHDPAVWRCRIHRQRRTVPWPAMRAL